VWDPISDRLLSIFETGKSVGSPGMYDGLLRQYVHGDQGYDDPVEVLTADTGGAAPVRYLPMFDEAGTGNLTAVLNDDGSLAERVMYGDSYGASPRYVQGPVVERVSRKVTKDANGGVAEVQFAVTLSERVVESSIASGVKVRSVRQDASLAALSTVQPALDSDGQTIRWRLTKADWDVLAGAPDATSIEVVVTKDLRAAGWGQSAVMAPPAWLQKLASMRTTTAEPLIAAESVDSINAASGENKLFEIRDLYLVASPDSKTKLFTGFKAAPFVETTSGFAFFRARWYDASTGTWLSPDSMGYRDSSNLYAFCGGDPVNCSDPTGLMGDGGDVREDFRQKENEARAKAYAAWCASHPAECRAQEIRGRGILRMVGGTGQTIAGVGAVSSTGPLPEPVTKTLGATAIVRGIDNFAAGFMETVTGQEYDTVTARGFYKLLVKSGVSPARASKITGWTEVGVDVVSTVGAGLVPSVNNALRIRPINGIIDVGGTSPGASNLNPLLGETGGQIKNVPNLTKDYADQIARYFEPGSAEQVVSVKLPGHTVNWEQFARGAYTTLRPGGVVDMNLYLTGPAAEQAAIRSAAVQALERAGFRNVTITGENVGTILKAHR
jgi:RHS repeat-associated protein